MKKQFKRKRKSSRNEMTLIDQFALAVLPAEMAIPNQHYSKLERINAAYETAKLMIGVRKDYIN